ncbi:MAG TPA: hypothetical protein ENJ97_05135 [Planctomycetes bacterium]|nr:hypothetical protein [Planctomycetota bacterium]
MKGGLSSVWILFSGILLLAQAGCVVRMDPDETPWCLQAVPTPEGRLFPTGVLETRRKDRPRRLFLEAAREGRRIGLALARMPSGEIRVADVVPGGPAARAGFRPGQVVEAPRVPPRVLLERMARRPGSWTVLEKGRKKVLRLRPVENLAGHTELTFPPFFSFSGDDSFLELDLALSFFSFRTAWEEKGPGELERRVTLSFFWGLVSF